jgi:hypothetical protein
MHRHEMQQSNIYLGIYIIVFYFFWKIRVLHQDGALGTRGSLEAQEVAGTCRARRGGGITPSCEGNPNASRG